MEKTEVKLPHGDFQKYVIEIERDIAKTIGPAIDDLRKIHGDRISNEVLASVFTLASARAIGMIHVWTGEPTEKIFKRFAESTWANIGHTVKRLLEEFAKRTPH